MLHKTLKKKDRRA